MICDRRCTVAAELTGMMTHEGTESTSRGPRSMKSKEGAANGARPIGDNGKKGGSLEKSSDG